MYPIPEAFRPHFRKSPATDPWEPLYWRCSDRAIDLFFEVRAAHCDARGILHGGVLAALCDNVMGLSLQAVLGPVQTHLVTINLVLDFIASAKVGEAVLIVPRVLRWGGSICFCDALASSGDQPLARSNATFRVRSVDSSPPPTGCAAKFAGSDPGFPGRRE
jgi:uncharacterized protein (TIGR00369 family)